MEGLAAIVFLIFIGGLSVVAFSALKHARKGSRHKPIKPAS